MNSTPHGVSSDTQLGAKGRRAAEQEREWSLQTHRGRKSETIAVSLIVKQQQVRVC
jgi:hypothetical protein